MKKRLFIIFFILFAASVILTTIIFIPKYGTYSDGNTKERTATGYYNLFQTNQTTTTNIRLSEYSQNFETLNVNLQIDYSQWLMITFVECFIFLLPASLLYKSNKKA